MNSELINYALSLVRDPSYWMGFLSAICLGVGYVVISGAITAAMNNIVQFFLPALTPPPLPPGFGQRPVNSFLTCLTTTLIVFGIAAFGLLILSFYISF